MPPVETPLVLRNVTLVRRRNSDSSALPGKPAIPDAIGRLLRTGISRADVMMPLSRGSSCLSRAVDWKWSSRRRRDVPGSLTIGSGSGDRAACHRRQLTSAVDRWHR